MHSNRSTNDSYHSDSSLRPKIKDKLTARIFLKPKKVKRSKTVVDVQKDVKLTVDKLRSRKLIKKTDITSKLASQVIKEYITPMFEADYKEKNIQNRAQAYGTRKSLPKSNLKLSDILSKQLKSLLKQKQHTENEYNRTISDTEKIKAEIDTCNQNLIEKLTFLKTIHYQYSETYKFNKLESLNLSYVNQDIVKNKNVLEGVERERDELAKELVREIEINEELNHESVELQHWNSAYKMTNDIMGESLKGLYFGISEISSCKFQEYLQNLIRNLTANLLSIQELEDFSENLLPQILLDNNKMVKESNQMSRSRDNLISDLKKLRLAVNDNLEDLKSKVKHTAQENENLNQRCVDMEKKTGDLNDEYNKIVEKLREMLPKQRLYGQYEEKLCKKCNVIFTESNNFNWSCASHKSEWGNGMYWCCGSTKKESPGCLKTKHASKDDEEFHTADHPVKPRETCTGCKISGHSSHSCPKDPNPNSFSDLKTEAIKARNSVRRRTRIGQLNFDTSNKLINVLRKRNKSANKENSFRDISSLRNHLTVDSSYNKISIDEVVLEENHMKSPTRSRTIPSRSTEIDTKYAPDYIDDKFSREFIEMLSQ